MEFMNKQIKKRNSITLVEALVTIEKALLLVENFSVNIRINTKYIGKRGTIIRR